MSKTVATKQKKRPGTAGEAIMCDETRNKDEGEERGWEGLEPNGARFIGRTKLAAPTPRILPLTSPMAPTIGHHPRGTCSSIIHLAVLIIHTRLLRTHRLLRPCTALVASWPYLSGLTYVETCSYLCSGIVVFFLRLVATTVDLENGLTVTFLRIVVGRPQMLSFKPPHVATGLDPTLLANFKGFEAVTRIIS